MIATTATKADTGKGTEYTKAKLATHSKLKKGQALTYHGRVKALDGKRVTIVDFESRGGVHMKAGDKAFTVSPFALLERPPAQTAKVDKPAPKAKAKAKKTKPTNWNGKTNGNGKPNGHTT